MTSVLLKYRLTSFRHASGKRAGIEILAFAVVLAVLLGGAGYLATETMMADATPRWVPEIGEQTRLPGQRALEMAFWGAALLCAVQCFRVMELLFRRADIVSLSLLPVPTRALFAERAITAIVEGAAMGAVGACFFAPLALAHPLVFLLCSVLLICGLVASSCLTMGIVMWFGNEYGHPDARVGGDAYGGSGGAFIYAPGAALAGSLVALILTQLALGEVLKSGAITRAFWVGLGLTGGLSLAGLWTAMKACSRYHLVAAWFREADTVGFTTDVTYQSTSWRPLWIEGWLPGLGAKLATRRTWIQQTRYDLVANSVQNVLYAGCAIAAVWMLDSEVPFWIAPTVIVTMVGPWKRAEAKVLGRQNGSVLPLTRRDDALALVSYGAATILVRAVPYAVFITAASAYQGRFTPWLLGAVFGPLAIHGAYALTLLSTPRPPVLGAAVIAVLIGAVAVWSLAAATFVGAVLSLGILAARAVSTHAIMLDRP
ncbi:MAG: hypothetical protein R3E66_11615 [bacterium]